MLHWKKNRRSALIVTYLFVLALVATGCGKEAKPQKAGEQPPAGTIDGFALITEAANSYLNAGKPPAMSPEEAFEAIAADDPGVFILSTRSAEDDEKGHIPGTVTIPYYEIWKEENLAKLPKDKKIIVVCYTGHTASQAAMFLNLLGYDAVPLKWGMMNWTNDPEVLSTKPFTGAPEGYPLETEKNELTETYELPEVETGKTELSDIILARAEAYLTAKKPPTISPEDLFNALASQDPGVLVLSIHSSDDYAKGHIPGAYNIPYADLARIDNLKKLPTEKKIVIICYDGHIASQAAMLLNLLGYDAVPLKWGMMNWTSNPAVLNIQPFTSAPEGYPVEKGK